MSDSSNFGFAKLVPGFDFLQNLAKGATQSMPQLSNWVAPTLNVEELEKRISELKAVQFWLDQNGRALAATIQALEVQKMTLATLEGMNFSMGELANSLRLKTTETVTAGARKGTAAAGSTTSAAAGAVDAAAGSADAMAGAGDAMPDAAGAARPKAGSKAESQPADNRAANTAPVDPLQWWSALTQQFQQIAASAMKDVAQKTAVEPARPMSAGSAREATNAATGMGRAATGTARASATAPVAPAATAKKASPRKAPARKSPAKKSTT
jgi:hypothetical protein